MFDKKKEKPIEGIIIEAFPSATFKARISGEEEILVYLSGKMRMNHIKVLPGDRVLIELGPDGKKGRVVRRL